MSIRPVPIDINWRRRIFTASPASWAWIYWLRVVSNFCMRICVVLTVCFMSGLDWFGYWPILPMYGLVLCVVVSEIIRLCLILWHRKLVFSPDTEMHEAEEAALVRARSILK